MSWTTRDIPDLHDTVSVVTGANGGLGLQTTLALASAGSYVVMAARDQDKAQAALETVRESVPEASVEIVELDLGSQSSTVAAAESIAKSHPRIDLLINNAGVMAMPEGRTEDDYETQLGINHLGHWTFTARLLPQILAAPAARVVTVTSTAHHMGRPIDPNNPNLEGRYTPWRAYGQSKLANFHFALGLEQSFRAHKAPAKSLMAHPGLSNTDLQARTHREGALGAAGARVEEMTANYGMSPADGALPQLRAATDPNARADMLYGPRYVNTGPPEARPILRRWRLQNAIRTLGEVSTQMTGERIAVKGD